MWIWKTSCKPVLSLTVGWKLAHLPTLPYCGMPLVHGKDQYSSVAAFFGPVALSVCSVAAREVVLGFGVCWAFCLKGLLLSQTQGAQHTIMALLPDTPRMVRWGCDGSLGLWWWLCFWQLGIWEISKLDFFSWLVPPCRDRFGEKLCWYELNLISQSPREGRGLVWVTKICGVTRGPDLPRIKLTRAILWKHSPFGWSGMGYTLSWYWETNLVCH